MKSVQIQKYGDRETLQLCNVEKPIAGDNELLIKIKAAGINPIDIKIRSGLMAGEINRTFPFILGWEASGVIETVGNAVDNFSVGDEVYTMPNFMQGGTYAEYVSVNSSEVSKKPEKLNFIEAAAVPMAAGAAYTALIKEGQIQKGQKILIHGAAGSVGFFAVQIAKSKGLEVYGTASGEGMEKLKSLQTDVCIDYTTSDFAAIAHNMDVVLDLVGGETLMRSFGILKKGGRLLSTVMPPPADKCDEYGIQGKFVFTKPDADMLTEIAQWIDSGHIKIKQPHQFTLDQVAAAHELIENRKAAGKLVVNINQ